MSGATPCAPLRALEEVFRQSLREIVREELRAVMAEQGGSTPTRNAGDTYLSIAKAAQFADVAPGTLRRWIRTGRLSARRAGRVHRISCAELETFLTRGAKDDAVVAKARKILHVAVGARASHRRELHRRTRAEAARKEVTDGIDLSTR